MTKKKLPLVTICGRPNVGKSTLYNRILGKQRAITHSEHGVTRDRRYGEATWEGYRFSIVDTGGIVESPVDPVTRKMQAQVRRAFDEATVIILVVDGREEITRGDEEIRDELFKCGKPIVLAVNKLDNPQHEAYKNEFFVLGLGEPFPISSGHGLGIDSLLDEVLRHLPEKPTATDGDEAGDADEAEDDDTVTKVAVIGKPNVGKSSFINALLNDERCIVDDQPGTTRDSIDIEFSWQGKEYLLIDTAGMRKKSGIKKAVEHYSVSRSLRTVRWADVSLVLVDSTDGITEQDKRIIGYVRDQGTAIVLCWTKWDLIEDREAKFKALGEELDRKVPYFKYVPMFTISNVTRKRLFTSFEYIDRVAEEATKRIHTAELNKFFVALRGWHKPSQRKGKLARILYATQASIKPTTFVLFVNQKRLFHFSYTRYIENQIRLKFGFEGVPIRLELREGEPKR